MKNWHEWNVHLCNLAKESWNSWKVKGKWELKLDGAKSRCHRLSMIISLFMSNWLKFSWFFSKEELTHLSKIRNVSSFSVANSGNSVNVKYRVMERKKPTKALRRFEQICLASSKVKSCQKNYWDTIKAHWLNPGAYPSDINRIFPGLFCIDFYQQI